MLEACVNTAIHTVAELDRDEAPVWVHCRTTGGRRIVRVIFRVRFRFGVRVTVYQCASLAGLRPCASLGLGLGLGFYR